MKIRLVTAYGVCLSLLGGCSTVIGPNAAHYGIKKTEVENVPTNVWTAFDRVEDAQTRLTNAAKQSRNKSRLIIQGMDANNDLSATAIVGGAVAGATGSPQGARIATGVAALLGMAPDRYRLESQRQNLNKVADAYSCIGKTVAGLSTDTHMTALILPIDGMDDEAVANLNRTRLNALRLVGETTEAVEQSFLDAMAALKIVSPDAKAIEQAITEKLQQKPSADQHIAAIAANSAQKSRGSAQNLASTPKPKELLHPTVAKKQLKALESQMASVRGAIDDLNVQKKVLEDLPQIVDKPELAKERKLQIDALAERVAALTKLSDDLAKQVSLAKSEYSQAVNALLETSNADVQMLLVDRMSTLEKSLAACKALMGS